MKIIIESQYLPCIAYFVLLNKAEEVVLEASENFEKQTYRNRTRILDPNKTLSLTIPVHHGGRKIKITELGIDYNQKWVNQHWRAVQSSYGKAPFFDYYADYFKEVLYEEHGSLFELNMKLLSLCLKCLQVQTKLTFTEKYVKGSESGVFDLRSVVHPKKDIASLTWFQPEPYYQIFGKDFVPNLSVLDLLFCVGPESNLVLQKSLSSDQNLIV